MVCEAIWKDARGPTLYTRLIVRQGGFISCSRWAGSLNTDKTLYCDTRDTAR